MSALNGMRRVGQSGATIIFALLVIAQGQLLNAAPAEMPIGRLFASPDERQSLDLSRSQERTPGVIPPATGQPPVTGQPEETSNALASGQPVRLSGVVLRADGRQILWLNGALVQQERHAPSHPVRGNRLRSANLRVELSPQQGVVKPGELSGQGGEANPSSLNPSAQPVAPVTQPVASPRPTAPAAPGAGVPAAAGSVVHER